MTKEKPRAKGFKLIALRTGERPSQPEKDRITTDFLKVLKPKTLYKFYNEYSLINKQEKPVEKDEPVQWIKFTRQIPQDLFDTENLNINVSAVVGKNGSGKSSLIELFFAGIYLLSLKEKLLDTNIETLKEAEDALPEKRKKWKEKSQEIKGKIDNIKTLNENIVTLFNELTAEEIKYYPSISILRRKINQATNEASKYDEGITEIDLEATFIEDSQKEIEWLISTIDVEIFYWLDDTFYQLKIGKHDKQDKHGKFVSLSVIASYEEKQSRSGVNNMRDLKVGELLGDPIDLSQHFFYSIAISYSHYGLNAIEDGSWIEELFHKNDSYQTPLVINPMRTDGNIDVNKENDLVKQRLLSNLLERVSEDDEETLRHLAPEKKAIKLLLKLNTDKFEYYKERHYLKKDNPVNTNECIDRIYKEYTGIDLNPIEPTAQAAFFYLRNKLIRMCTIYNRYKDFLYGNQFDIDSLAKAIIKDQSHITFKLKQAMNFIRHGHISGDEPNKEFSVDIDQLSIIIGQIIAEEKEKGRQRLTIEYLPPSVFDIRIELADESFFETMSSGEKQKIYSINSIIYHLINLNSVFKNGDDEQTKSINQYSYINIFFDEVEQYFHTDLQRTFIYDLLNFLKKINSELVDCIDGVNILFATHSPFILSDIPSANVLRLNDGNPVPNIPSKETFGANIYDLLADDFFMQEGFVGKVAMEKITAIIKYINNVDSYDKQKQKYYTELV